MTGNIVDQALNEILNNKNRIISVIICTYNREDLLGQAILSVVNQSLPSDQYEIIIVDNNSTDTTREIAEKFINEFPDRAIRYVFEKTPGLGYARKTGAKEAKGQYVGFLDDDAKADVHYLEKASKAIKDKDVLLSFGGPIHPFYLAPKPDWFKNEYEIRTWGDEVRWLEKGVSLSGSNMFFLKSMYSKISENSEALGMKADQMAFGEDNMLFENLNKLFPDKNNVLYVPDMIVYHAVPEFKMKIGYMIKRRYTNGCSTCKRNLLDKNTNIPHYFLKYAYFLFRQLLRFISHVFRYKYWQQWVYEEFGPIAKSLGFLMTLLKVPFSFKNR